MLLGLNLIFSKKKIKGWSFVDDKIKEENVDKYSLSGADVNKSKIKTYLS